MDDGRANGQVVGVLMQASKVIGRGLQGDELEGLCNESEVDWLMRNLQACEAMGRGLQGHGQRLAGWSAQASRNVHDLLVIGVQTRNRSRLANERLAGVQGHEQRLAGWSAQTSRNVHDKGFGNEGFGKEGALVRGS
eukprot:1161037-Pelagomonas_calceolata.AAC.2